MSEDVINIDNKRNGDWYLCQLAELNLEIKEISELIKKQLKIIKEQYKIEEIEEENHKNYIFTNSPDIKVDDLREQILRLVKVSKEAKKILKNRNAFISNTIAKPL